MLKKIILLALFTAICLSIRQRDTTHNLQDHDGLFKKPYNPKNRSEGEVCEHYGGKMCTALKLYTKCCKDGTFTKGTHCGGVGCEHDTLSLSSKDWNYADDKPQTKPTTPTKPTKPTKPTTPTKPKL